MSFLQKLSQWAAGGPTAAGGAAVGNILRLGDVTVTVDEVLAQGPFQRERERVRDVTPKAFALAVPLLSVCSLSVFLLARLCG